MLPSETGDEAVLKIIGPGEIFGEMALLDGSPRSATVVTLEPVETATLSRADFARARAGVEARMDATRRRLAGQAATRTLAALPVGEQALREAWENRGLSWRRAVLAAVVERVVLHPCLQGRNVFDPSRIEVVWRT